MAWIPVFNNNEPYILDDQTGERIAVCLKYENMHEPPTHAWSRACVMALAPELHHKLADMCAHGQRHFPEPLQAEVTECLKLLEKVSKFYEQREPGQTNPRGIQF